MITFCITLSKLIQFNILIYCLGNEGKIIYIFISPILYTALQHHSTYQMRALT